MTFNFIGPSELSNVHSFPEDEVDATCTKCGLKRFAESHLGIKNNDTQTYSKYFFSYQKPGSRTLYGAFSDIPCEVDVQ